MKICYIPNRKCLDIPKRKFNTTKVSLFYLFLMVMCVLGDFFEILKQDLLAIANENKNAFPMIMDMMKETKGIYIDYSFKSKIIFNKIIKYTINHSVDFLKKQLSMCVINRKHVNLKESKDQIAILDLCGKSLEYHKNIFTFNAFTIYNLSSLTLKDIDNLILKSIEDYNHDIDIFFYNEFGILNHHVISERLFNCECI